ncbi:hypothetical protein PQC13_gp091 [Synechococcus phage S-SRM01]|uniref:Uncharacterized protein n=1 Tax=Synechococcus phage S-SRM01 TaxID=2781608 RepID=A0A879R331_9CAUD|nr:hypothetical protein PQC13_gp091 [Synechococcus phage S-SRM01]QPX48056.1 hypothetical protein [Synechococcus phage S-SRM01]
MTSQSPRIYIYKIIFEEVPYYYYGVHKEKKFNEEYFGSPVTHKWCWEFYTPKKQILEFFEFSDEGYIKAQEVEARLIRPVFNIDKWCLNENCLGVFSLEQKRKAGKIGGKNSYEMKLGVHGRTKEQKVEDAKKGGLIGGNISKELGLGINSLTSQERAENAKKGHIIQKELGLGLYGIPKEKRIETVKEVNSQRWECCKTGYISTSAGLTKYQKSRGIDTSKRRRLS